MTTLAPEVLDDIREFDTCTIANAIERFHVRLRNEGYTSPGLQIITGGFPRVIGYAATASVRSADPPVTGGFYLERTEWWDAIQKLPVPRIAVIQDLEPASARGSVAGEVHASILKAFQCHGLVTNGGVRDIPAVNAMGFPMFARAVSVSHAYSHLVEYGQPVDIFGLKIRSGDLLYADCHGAITIPAQIAAALPGMARKVREQERRIIAVCQSAAFSPDRLREAIRSDL